MLALYISANYRHVTFVHYVNRFSLGKFRFHYYVVIVQLGLRFVAQSRKKRQRCLSKKHLLFVTLSLVDSLWWKHSDGG